jgi:hypothetical protein
MVEQFFEFIWLFSIMVIMLTVMLVMALVGLTMFVIASLVAISLFIVFSPLIALASLVRNCK